MFCPKCGTKLPDGSKFCVGCGSKMPEVAAPVQPVPAAPVTPAKAPKPKKTGGINWTVLIILLLVGALILGAGVWILIRGFEDGFDNIFGDGTSQNDDDDDDDDDDDKDKDDDDDDRDDDDKDASDPWDDNDDPVNPPQTTPDQQTNPTVAEPPEPTYPDYTDPTEPDSESWYYNYVDGLALFLPERFTKYDDSNYFSDGTIDVTVTRLTIFDLADAWIVNPGSLYSAYSVASVYADMVGLEVQSQGESCFVEHWNGDSCFIQGYFVMDESVWQITVRANVYDEMTYEDMLTVLLFAEVEG